MSSVTVTLEALVQPAGLPSNARRHRLRRQRVGDAHTPDHARAARQSANTSPFIIICEFVVGKLQNVAQHAVRHGNWKW